MKKNNNKLALFFESLPESEQQKLPINYGLMNEKPDSFPPRKAPSKFYRALDNPCISFYKPISQITKNPYDES